MGGSALCGRCSIKKRPAVVISNHAFNQISRDILLTTLTTQIKHQHLPGRLVIDHLAAGLEKPSMTKPVLFTLEKGMIASKAGRLAPQDRQMLQQTLFTVIRDSK